MTQTTYVERYEMREAAHENRCYITRDGWCATHSTADGPVYCQDAR